MYDIAKKTLGDGRLWGQIAQLNPGYSGTSPVPAGAVLNLPPGAYVPQN
jgi:hypothetical protein